MIGIVVVTHGQLATELVNAAETIVGDLPQFAAVSIGWHEDVQDARNDIAAAIERVKGPSGVLIATDMFGGTPSNLGITFLEEDVVEIVTGVNLPMLIKAASLQGSARLTDVARSLREHGRNAIWVASDLLTGSTGSDQVRQVLRVQVLQVRQFHPVQPKSDDHARGCHRQSSRSARACGGQVCPCGDLLSVADPRQP